MRTSFWGVVVLVLFMAGCGGGSGATVTPVPVGTSQGSIALGGTPTPTPTLEELLLEDPALALQQVPLTNLDYNFPLTPNGQLTVSVDTLESQYETLFCQLSAKFDVTLTTPQSVQKIDFIKSQAQTGHFDLLAKPIENNPAGVQNVVFQPILYNTSLPTSPQIFNVSGGLLMPDIDKASLRGVIVFFHGTTFDKSMVPSNYATNAGTQMLAQIFASQGYVVVAPDYIGQGVDWQTVHPYVLYPTASVQAALDMLTAVKPVIVSRYQLTNADGPLKLFSAGYSEGGAYSLWFNVVARTQALDPLYSLTHSVGMEGAYDTSTVTRGYLFDDVSKRDGNPYHVQTQLIVNAVKPPLSADAFLSYAVYSDNSSFSDVFNENFFDLDCDLLLPQSDCNVGGAHLNIAQAFAQPATDIISPLVFGGLGKSNNGSTYPLKDELATSTKNSINALVSTALFDPAQQQKLAQTLAAADVNLSSVPDKTVSIITLAEDSVVVSNNFDALSAKSPTKILTAIKIDQNQLPVLSPHSKPGDPKFAPVDHGHAIIYECIYALNIFNQF